MPIHHMKPDYSVNLKKTAVLKIVKILPFWIVKYA